MTNFFSDKGFLFLFTLLNHFSGETDLESEQSEGFLGNIKVDEDRHGKSLEEMIKREGERNRCLINIHSWAPLLWAIHLNSNKIVQIKRNAI